MNSLFFPWLCVIVAADVSQWKRCLEGTYISVRAQVMQKSGDTVHFKMTMQYDGSNGTVYDTFAEADAVSGKWTTISVTDYLVQNCSSPLLYFETDSSTCDFYLDDVLAMKTDGNGWPSEMSQAGDVDHSGFVDSTDAELLRDDLLGNNTDIYADNADLALLKKSIL